MKNINHLHAKSLAELKALASALGISPTGDRRNRFSWIQAIEVAESTPENSLEIEFEPEESAPKNRNLKVLTSSKSDEHYTPENIVEAAREVMGAIDLDPMSCCEANSTVRATTFYAKEENGLNKPWFGKVWLNPPFSLVQMAVENLLGAYEAGVTEACLLIKAAPDTKRHQLLAAFPFCEIQGRLKFLAEGNSQSAPFATLVFYLGKNFSRFREVFGRFGNIRLGQNQVDKLESDRRELLAKVAQLELELAKKSEAVVQPDRRMDWLKDDLRDRVTTAETRLKAWDLDNNTFQFEILSRQRIEWTARLEELKSLQRRVTAINVGYFGNRWPEVEQKYRQLELEELEGWRSEFAIGKLVQAEDTVAEIERFSRIKGEWIAICRIKEKGEDYLQVGKNFYLRAIELIREFQPYQFSEEKRLTYRLGSVRTAKELKSLFGVRITTANKACGTELSVPDGSIWQAFKDRNTERCAIKWRCEVLPNGASISPRIAQKNDRLEAVANLNSCY